MTKVYCASCNLELPDSMIICPSCGNRNFSPTPIQVQPEKLDPPATASSSPKPQNLGGLARGRSNLDRESMAGSALQALSGNWGICAWICFIYLVLYIPAQLIPILGSIVSLVIAGPFGVAWAKIALKLTDGHKPETKDLFSGFNSDVLWLSIGVGIISTIFITLWTILLIIPGIIAALAYSMIYFIILDNPTISPLSAISKSKSLMYGYKSKFFVFVFQCFLLGVLSLVTIGIGFIFLIPFYYTGAAIFYRKINSLNEQQ